MKKSNNPTIKSYLLDMMNWLFGLTFFGIGLVNTFWGNDPGFGVFIILLSLIYFPPITTLLKVKTGISIHMLIKIGLGLFIIWASLGVGELFDKIDMMMTDF